MRCFRRRAEILARPYPVTNPKTNAPPTSSVSTTSSIVDLHCLRGARAPKQENVWRGTTNAEIAAMYGVKFSSLKVLCSQRGISLRKGGPLPPRNKLFLPDEPLPLSDGVLKSLREATRAMGKRSTARLVSDLLERIVSDDLYKAVLDEEIA